VRGVARGGKSKAGVKKEWVKGSEGGREKWGAKKQGDGTSLGGNE